MKRLVVLLLAGALLPAVGPAVRAQALAADLVCDGSYHDRTFRHVVIPDGASCVITNSQITGNVRTTGAPRVVSITDTPVRRNIHIRNVTQRVTIGADGCRVDPVAGRNLMVRDSHNVAVCEMSVANNLVIRNNTGILMIRDNKACNNLRVVGNDVRSMRVVRNSYAGNLTVARNTWVTRRVVRDNVELPGNPARCRRAG
ncbi:hypothetical protein [Nocardioides speluncae]|uniref:hypothetical protein n=1 Tax=Nocardioides speluncae TaxID=2670337 RepID=UPI000D6858FA|nr:hypothetical protein [Nocardioides speluncae]